DGGRSDPAPERRAGRRAHPRAALPDGLRAPLLDARRVCLREDRSVEMENDVRSNGRVVHDSVLLLCSEGAISRRRPAHRADTDRPAMSDEDRLSIPLDLEDALHGLLKVDPGAPPAKPNEDQPTPEQPLKHQGDALVDDRTKEVALR